MDNGLNCLFILTQFSNWIIEIQREFAIQVWCLKQMDLYVKRINVVRGENMPLLY